MRIRQRDEAGLKEYTETTGIPHTSKGPHYDTTTFPGSGQDDPTQWPCNRAEENTFLGGTTLN